MVKFDKETLIGSAAITFIVAVVLLETETKNKLILICSAVISFIAGVVFK